MCLEEPLFGASLASGLEASHLALALPILAIGGGLLTAIVAIIGGNLRKAAQTRHREETKRELAAYVAEGTMTPENAERILRSDQKEPWGRPGKFHT